MNHHEQEVSADTSHSTGDGLVDAVAACIIVLSLAAMGLLWVSSH